MILWVDPGIRKLWYAIIDDQKNIVDAGILLQDMKSPTRDDQFMRLYNIYSFFMGLFHEYPITHVCIEKLFFSSWNQANAEFVYGVRGAVIALAYENNAEIMEMSPVSLKKAITGNWKAGKPLIQSTIMRLFWLEQEPEYHDAADALGLAYVALQKNKKNSLKK